MTSAFIHGNLIDVVNKTLIPDGTILVKDGIITEAGPETAVPEDAFVTDLKGKIVVPGLFNCMYICVPMQETESDRRSARRLRPSVPSAT